MPGIYDARCVPNSPTTINPDTAGTHNGVRLVFSFCYSIDSRDEKLMSELLTNDVRMATCGQRNDYTINKVVDSIETGCLLHKVLATSPTDAIHPAPKKAELPTHINPTKELMESGLGLTNPPAFNQIQFLLIGMLSDYGSV